MFVYIGVPLNYASLECNLPVFFPDSGAFEYNHSPRDCHGAFDPSATAVQSRDKYETAVQQRNQYGSAVQSRDQFGSAVQSCDQYGTAVQSCDQFKTADHGKQEESGSDILDTLSDSSGDNMEEDFVDDPLQELGTCNLLLVQLLYN